MDIANRNIKTLNDLALLQMLGEFVKYHRLEQNKTQNQLAEEAGISRITLSQFEKGNRSNTLTIIQLLRALGQLHLLVQFQVQTQPGPLQLAKLEQKKRKRASRTNTPDQTTKSDW
jgi:transcriptional regulator with XRE-family HTH domain